MSDSGKVLIHGKEYETVALRVRKFRDVCPEYTLATEIVERTEDVVVMKATILDQSGRVIATGHAEEYRKSSQINKTSALENAETSAIGRCLAAFGLGGTEFATADEVANAIGQQKGKSVAKETLESQDQETQKWLGNMADSIRSELTDKGAESALSLLDEQDLDADTKTALWAFFDSKERKAIKDASAARKAKA